MYLNYLLDLIIPPKDPLPQVQTDDLAQHFRNKPWPPRTPASWIHSSFSYQDPDVQKAIFHLKKYRDRRVVSALSERLHDHLTEIEAEHFLLHRCRQTIVIPIPLHRTSHKKRGFNQSLLLAQALIKKSPHRSLSAGLVCTQHKAKQALLSRSERIKNVIGGYRYHGQPLPSDSLIVILDDVTTTGATLHEARLQLFGQAPQHNLKALTLAH